jgi:MFS family permease
LTVAPISAAHGIAFGAAQQDFQTRTWGRAMRGRGLILATLCLAALIINLDITILNVALPALVRQLGATTTSLQWAVGAYNLVFAALVLAAGSLADRLGRKGMLLAAVVALLVARRVPTSRDPRTPPVDWRGFALSTAGMSLIVYGIIQAPVWGWASAATVGMLAAGAAVFGLLVVAERRAAHPMIDTSLFRNPRFTAAAGTVAIAFFALLGFIFLMTLYFQVIRGYSPLATGIRLFGSALGVAVIGSVAASLYTSRLDALLLPGLPACAVTAAHGSVGGAAAAAQQLTRAGLPGPAHALRDAAVAAFLHSLTGACLVAAGVAAAGILLVAFLLPARPRAEQAEAKPAAGVQPRSGPAPLRGRTRRPGGAATHGPRAGRAPSTFPLSGTITSA